MKVFRCRMQFTTPAFVGDAARNGAWRTPPIKALLRQFWRMHYAARHSWTVDVATMRADEGALFGSVNAGALSRSKLRLRLDSWSQGKLARWAQAADASKVQHPEVARQSVDPALYLGYGALAFAKGEVKLEHDSAIQANESAVLKLAVPNEDAPAMAAVLGMLNSFGTLGGRSRNGWGSFTLEALEGSESIDAEHADLVRDWRDALDCDWPHALGKDDSGVLIWRTPERSDWEHVIRDLAELKIGFRTQFRFAGRDSVSPQPRHWLAYPVTHHKVQSWDNNARLPNSLRFKIVPYGHKNLRGLLFHMPCLPPRQFKPDRAAIEHTWQQVHQFLDARGDLERMTRGLDHG